MKEKKIKNEIDWKLISTRFVIKTNLKFFQIFKWQYRSKRQRYRYTEKNQQCRQTNPQPGR